MVFTLEKEIPHTAPEADMALVSQMKANIEFSARSESEPGWPTVKDGVKTGRCNDLLSAHCS